MMTGEVIRPPPEHTNQHWHWVRHLLSQPEPWRWDVVYEIWVAPVGLFYTPQMAFLAGYRYASPCPVPELAD